MSLEDTETETRTGGRRSEVDDLIAPYLTGSNARLVSDSGDDDTRRAVVSNTIGRLLRLGGAPLDVSLDTETTRVAPGDPIEFTVTITNHSAVGIPLSLDCSTLWGWYVDGTPEGEREAHYESPSRMIRFRGSQSYTFERTWSGFVREGDSYEPLSPGVHELEASLHVVDAAQKGLVDSVTFHVEER
ncbi:hypothetical protein [Haloferax sp. YSMS24]|uniref:hypothetical protein n=1 Tax=Haloferax sp. YSMS24 TaxID=3388425 RepID=UPI00398D61A7